MLLGELLDVAEVIVLCEGVEAEPRLVEEQMSLCPGSIWARMLRTTR